MALEHGAYVGIASHDIPVVNYTLDVLNEFKMGPNSEDPRDNAGTQRRGKGPVGNSKCSLVFEGRCVEN